MSHGIHAYVGFNGGGKTLCMVEREALPALRQGRPVFANFRIGNPYVEGDWMAGAHPLRDPSQLMELSDCTLLLDEITSIFPSRQSQSLPPDMQRLLHQMRKRDITIGWSAPNWARSDKMLREVTQSVTVCRGFLPQYVTRDERGRVMRYACGSRCGGRKHFGTALVPGVGVVEGWCGRRVRWPNSWKPNQLFKFSTYSAVDFEEFSINATQRIKATSRKFYWRRRHEAHHRYSTLEEVMLFAHLDDVGICLRCNGSRPRKRCTCVPADMADTAGASAPEVPAS